jgi:hypothetical protein
MKNGQIVGLDSTNIANTGIKGGNLVNPLRATLDMYITGLIKPDSLLLGSNTSFRSSESEIIASSDTLQTLGLKLKALSSNTNSPIVQFISNTTGTLKAGSIYGAYGADPYIVFAAPNDAGAEIPVFHLHDTSIAFVTDNTVDIGGTSDNRPKDINISGHFIGLSVKGDSLRMGADTQLHRESANKIATDDTIEAASFQSSSALKWQLDLDSFGLAAQDSAAAYSAYTVGRDTTQTITRNRKYIDFTRGPSPSMKAITLSDVIANFPVLNPDSLLVDVYSHSNSADSIEVCIRVKYLTTTIFNSGWIVPSAAMAWEHNAFVLATPFIKDQEYEVFVDVYGCADNRLLISGLQFK